LNLRILVFFLIGLLIFVIDVGLNSDESSKDIYITDQELSSLLSAWTSQVGRDPTDEEVVNIINNLVQEEILYREALLLGLDQEDRIIKRRLAQKLTFLKQETMPEEPTEQELLDFYESNKANYFIPPTYSFKHHYFSKESDAKERANAALNAFIDNGLELRGDPFFLGKNFNQNTIAEIERSFGASFLSAFAQPKLNQWSGPYQSAFGEHVIFITDTSEGFFPPWKKIASKVTQDYLTKIQDDAVNQYLDDIKSQYRVIINPNYQF
jgi:parvulin-like peptidyl-prolyl isomerase